MLVSKNAKICITPNAKPKICITPNAIPHREQVEFRQGCVRSPSVGARVGHVHSIFFVFILFELGSQCESRFQRNMGFTLSMKKNGKISLQKLNYSLYFE